MSESTWQQTVDLLRREVISVRGRAEALSPRFSAGCRQAELLKLAFMLRCLERQRRHLARTRGVTSILRNGQGLRKSLALGAFGLVVGGMINRDKYFAVKEGLAGFDTALQAQGQTSWAVALGKNLRVGPKGDFAITQGKTLVTWESLRNALVGLGREALQGTKLGNLDSVLVRLQRCKELVHLGLAVKTITFEPKGTTQGPENNGLRG